MAWHLRIGLSTGQWTFDGSVGSNVQIRWFHTNFLNTHVVVRTNGSSTALPFHALTPCTLSLDRHKQSLNSTLPKRYKVHLVHASIRSALPYGRGGRFVTCSHGEKETAHHHWRWHQQAITRIISVDRLAIELQRRFAFDPMHADLDLAELHQLWQRVRSQQCKVIRVVYSVGAVWCILVQCGV
jgi:hypothetical protein